MTKRSSATVHDFGAARGSARKEPTLAELDHASSRLTEWTQRYGDWVFPLFDMVEAAREPLTGREERLRAALARAG